MKKLFFRTCLAVFLTFGFFLLQLTQNAYAQDSSDVMTTISDSGNSVSQDIQVEISPEQANNLKNSPFYTKWWFSLIFVLLIAPFYATRTKKNKDEREKMINTLEGEIIQLKKQLKEKEEKIEEKIENKQENSSENELIFQSEGIAILSEILSKNKNNTEVLGQKIISEIVNYTGANSGAIYIIKNEDEDDPYLEFLGGFAPSAEQIASKFKVGEGYIGTCFKEGKTMELSNATENYLKVSSGLGEAKPAFISFIPLIQDEFKLGVIEIAAFKKLEPYKIKLIEKFSENFASTLALNSANEKMQFMLEQSRTQAKELQEQEEKLRQNLEEMQATQEELQRKMEENVIIQSELANETALLNALLDTIPEYIYFKDLDSKFLKNSKSLAKSFGFENSDPMRGKSDFDFFDEEHARPAFNDEQKIIKTGEAIIDLVEKEVKKDGSVSYVSTTKMPLRDINGKIIGTFGISKDITKQKKIEMDMQEKNEQLLAQEEELRQNLEEMQATQEEMQRQVNENIRIQDELKREKSLMDALMDNIPDAIYFKDLESKFIKNSRSQIKMFGFDDPDALIGKSDFDFFDEAHARPAYNDEQKIIKTGKPIIDLVEKEVKKDGTISWVSTTKMPLKDHKGKIIGTFGISRNITEIKKMEQDMQQKNEELLAQEEELRQNLEEMQATQEEMQRQVNENIRIQDELKREKSLMDALMDNIPDAIYFKDLESKFIKNSRSQIKMFGFDDPDALIGKSDFDFFDEAHARPAYNDEQKIIKTGKPIIDLVEKEVKKDGTISWVSTTKMPLKDHNGKILGTFGISRNITEIKKMEQDMQQKNEELLAQEEELRQNLEEMQATQDEMFRVQEELKKEKYLMDALMNNIPDVIYFKDGESKFIKNSRSHAKLFGFEDAAELVGKSDFDFFDDQHARPAYNDEQKIIKTGKPIIDLVEKEVKKDGTISWVSSTKMPLKDNKGVIIGTFGISKNITKLKEIETLANQKEKELEECKEKSKQLQQKIKQLEKGK